MDEMKTAPEGTDELAEAQARIGSLRTQNEALARRANRLEDDLDRARQAYRTLLAACTFMTGYLTAVEAWAKRACVAEGAATTRAQIAASMANAEKTLHAEG